MKKLLLILSIIFISMAASANGGFYIYSISADTAVAGQTITFTATYVASDRGSWALSDTLKISLYQPLVFKMRVSDANQLPINPDGTRTFTFVVPKNYRIGKWSPVYPNSVSSFNPSKPDSIYIRSNVPDVSFISFPAQSGHVGDVVSFKISYTYKFSSHDTINIYIGSDLAYKGIYSESIYFTVPSLIDGNYEMTFNFSSITSLFKMINPATATIPPTSQEQKEGLVYYYNYSGVLIGTAMTKEKPNIAEGLYIFRIEYSDNTYSCGKFYME